jgi:hypothetical protein
VTVKAAVHGNVAAAQVNAQVDRSRPPMTWYAADGTVLKQVGR